jgi:hypothetical protein
VPQVLIQIGHIRVPTMPRSKIFGESLISISATQASRTKQGMT